MKRRDLLKWVAGTGLMLGQPLGISQARATTAPYTGPLFITLAADGGWDVTSFCDPKADPSINHWANSGSVRSKTGSPITWAPFAMNEAFFTRFASDMLVINGIDTQTNAHQAGQRHVWSGRLAEGYPSFGAIAAASLGADLPLGFISNGGYKETAGIATYTLMQDPSALSKLVYPNKFLDYDPTDTNWDPAKQYHRNSALNLIDQAKRERLQRLSGQTHTPHMQRSIEELLSAKEGQAALAPLADTLPATLASYTDEDGEWNPLLRQAQIALACYKAGLTVAADLSIWGFDTHANHDAEHSTGLQRLQRGITFLWDEAERMGIADRVIVCIASDFGRTPGYNDGNGKDHWPVTSTIFMAKNKSWTNRVIGHTTAMHDAQRINPEDFTVDDSGILLEPKHIQHALRQLAGITGNSFDNKFPLHGAEFDFFS
jgi:uncharacterized protein (DUF1501 family)